MSPRVASISPSRPIEPWQSESWRSPRAELDPIVPFLFDEHDIARELRVEQLRAAGREDVDVALRDGDRPRPLRPRCGEIDRDRRADRRLECAYERHADDGDVGVHLIRLRADELEVAGAV